MSLPLNQIVHGDCVKVLQGFPENSVDLVVTDPPYGLGFMGKEWDKALPPREAFVEIIRVLKPGALAFVMSSPRQDLMARMIMLLENAGFETNLSFIDWIYKTGFPKAYDVSKGIDKKLGLDRKVIAPSLRHGGGREFAKGCSGFDTEKHLITEPASDLAVKWEGWKAQTGLKPAHEPILMVYKPRSEGTIVDNVLRWGTGAINVDACRIPILQEDRHEYGISGDEGNPTVNAYGKYNRVMYEQHNKGRFPANLIISDGVLDTGETTKSGTFRKRDRDRGSSWRKMEGLSGSMGSVEAIDNYGDEGSPFRFFDLDAWAVHHGFLDVTKPDTNERNFGLQKFKKKNESVGIRHRVSETILVRKNAPKIEEVAKYLKIWRKKRGLTQNEIDVLMGWNTNYSWLEGRKKGILLTNPENWIKLKKIICFDNKFDKQMTELIDVERADPTFEEALPRRNTHPTVKPIKLMAYLIELGCPKDGVVLDPFVGSGTTCIAAKRLCRRYIGIELSEEYHALAVSRVAAYPQPLEWFENIRKEGET